MVLDSQGNVIVGERGNHRIQKFDPTGEFLMKFGSEGSGDGQFSKLEHIAVDQAGNVYVADPQANPERGNGIPHIQKFDSNGTYITKWGSKGEGEGQFNEPEHLAVDSKGYVYVSDRANDNIQSFAPSSNC